MNPPIGGNVAYVSVERKGRELQKNKNVFLPYGTVAEWQAELCKLVQRFESARCLKNPSFKGFFNPFLQWFHQ